MTGIFNEIYTFFYTWLFGGGTSYLAENDQRLVCLLLSCVVLVWVLWIAILPIKAILSAVFRW